MPGPVMYLCYEKGPLTKAAPAADRHFLLDRKHAGRYSLGIRDQESIMRFQGTMMMDMMMDMPMGMSVMVWEME